MTNNKVVIPVELRTTVSNMDSAIGEIQKKLKGLDINFNTSQGGKWKKLFQDYERESKDFQARIAKGEIDILDEKEFQRQGAKVKQLYEKIIREVGSSPLSLDMAKTLFPGNFTKGLDDIKNKVKETLKNLKSNSEIWSQTAPLQTEVEKLKTDLENLGKVKTTTDWKADIDAAKVSIQEANAELEKLYNTRETRQSAEAIARKEVRNNDNPDYRRYLGYSGAIGKIQGQRTKNLNGYGLDAATKSFIETDTNAAKKFFQAERAKALKSGDTKRGDEFNTKFNAAFKYAEDTKALETTKKAQQDLGQLLEQKIQERAKAIIDSMFADDAEKVPESMRNMYEQGAGARKKRNEAQQKQTEAEQKKETAPTPRKKATDMQAQEREIAQITQKITELQAKTKNVNFQELKNALKAAGLSEFADEIDYSGESLKKLQGKLETLDDENLEKLNQALADYAKNADQGGAETDALVAALRQMSDSAKDTTRLANDAQNLANSINQFFSISNGIQLFKNAIRDAYNTIKELDAAMTEMAVVTDFSIGDMWDMLPQYTAAANELGRATVDMYSATAKYVQQGLEADQAMQLGVETLKMAAVAGIDASQATETMTSALRGFNMELNEVSAQRVNDVYSELAKISAADTEQIGTAMSKVASLAHSANMEFETTTAFLTQIIETTQEAPKKFGYVLLNGWELHHGKSAAHKCEFNDYRKRVRDNSLKR